MFSHLYFNKSLLDKEEVETSQDFQQKACACISKGSPEKHTNKGYVHMCVCVREREREREEGGGERKRKKDIEREKETDSQRKTQAKHSLT